MNKSFLAPEAFSFDGPDVAQRWSRWAKGFSTYFLLQPGSRRNRRKSKLLFYSMRQGMKLKRYSQRLNSMTRKIDLVLQHFEKYCNSSKNIVFERYKFQCRKQLSEESVDKWVKELRTIAVNCEYGDQESGRIRDQVVYGVREDRTKERMLREKDLPLQKAMEICRAAESAKSQMKEMSETPEAGANVNELRTGSGTGRRNPSNHGNSSNNNGNNNNSNSNNNNNNNNSNNNNYGQHNQQTNQCFNCEGWGHFSRDALLATPSKEVVEIEDEAATVVTVVVEVVVEAAVAEEEKVVKTLSIMLSTKTKRKPTLNSSRLSTSIRLLLIILTTNGAVSTHVETTVDAVIVAIVLPKLVKRSLKNTSKPSPSIQWL